MAGADVMCPAIPTTSMSPATTTKESITIQTTTITTTSPLAPTPDAGCSRGTAHDWVAVPCHTPTKAPHRTAAGDNTGQTYSQPTLRNINSGELRLHYALLLHCHTATVTVTSSHQYLINDSGQSTPPPFPPLNLFFSFSHFPSHRLHFCFIAVKQSIICTNGP